MRRCCCLLISPSKHGVSSRTLQASAVLPASDLCQLLHPTHFLARPTNTPTHPPTHPPLHTLHRSPAGSPGGYKTELWVAALDLANNLPHNRYVLGFDVLGFQVSRLHKRGIAGVLSKTVNSALHAGSAPMNTPSPRICPVLIADSWGCALTAARLARCAGDRTAERHGILAHQV